MTRTIVIAGAGQAGGWAAQTLRKEGFTGSIFLIGDEAHPPHERPPLSKAVLSGDSMPESTHLIKADAFDKLALDWRRGVRVTGLDRAGKTVTLDDGESIGYDKLILCTGGRARTLNLPGADQAGIHVLRTIDDALALGRELQPGRKIVIIGGGWIGLEVAATARKRGAEAVVVEAMTRLCERTVPKEISDYLLSLHSKHGARILLGAGVEGFGRDDRGRLTVRLSDGRAIDCDAAVIGVGLVPNDDLARQAGLVCDAGIVVDEQCRTSDPEVFAAGDVAVLHVACAGRRMRLESWQNAQDQGIAAARSALGIAVAYQPLPWFWSDQYDMNLQIYGIPSASQQLVVRGDPASDSFVFFYLDDSRVKAALGPNASRDLRFARRLIESQKIVAAERLADVSVPMAKL